MRKGLIRDLDVQDDTGRALAVLSRGENSLLSAAAMYVLVEASVPALQKSTGMALAPAKLWERVWRIAESSSDVAREVARALIHDLGLNETVQAAILDLADNFLLCALIPKERAPARQVLKFSYHWEGAKGSTPRYYFRLGFAGLGFCSARVLVEAPGVDTANSYHLEIAAPRGLLVTDIASAEASRTTWPTPSPVGHVHASGGFGSVPTAAVYLRLAGPGLLTTMFLYLIVASAILSFMRFYPPALANAAANTDAVTALVTLAPALLFGLATRGAENSIVARMLLPLRTIAGLLSAYFLGLSALLIFAGPALAFAYVKWGLDATAILTLLVGTGRTLTWLSTHIAASSGNLDATADVGGRGA